MSIFGWILGFTFLDGLVALIGAVTPGGFIYIATSELVPELHKETNIKKSMASFMFFIIGVGLMFTIKIIAQGGLD